MSSRCRSCGANVRWITHQSGRRMILDDAPLTVLVGVLAKGDPPPTTSSRWVVVTTSYGVTVSGWTLPEEPLDPDHVVVGYEDHHATCPQAARWKRSAKRRSA